MDHEHHRPPSGGGRLIRPQKLKDSCDMCSASKVRCDKKKPICNRCERLGYPCFFSPARRVRKHRCVRSISSANEPEVTKKSPMPQPRVVESATPKVNAIDDTAEFHFGDGISGADPLEVDKSCSATPSGDDTSMPLQNISHHDSSSSSTMEPVSMGLGFGQCSPSIGSEFDCATVAMILLQHLNVTSRKESSTATPVGGIRAPALDASINTASMAIKRVSTILICPCSKKPDVGILAAAVCAALLDTYEVLLCNSARSKSGLSSTEKNRGVKRSSVHRVTRDAEGMEKRINVFQDWPNEKATTMRILEELPKFANLVTQYTRRYSFDTEKCWRDLPQALAASITSRLKSMIDEVTNWVAQT